LILEAFQAESGRLSEIAAGTDDAAFARPSPCTPWTVAELFFHVRMTMARLSDMLAEPEPGSATTSLVTAPGYYRADQRFSPAANDDRIQSARRGAAAFPNAADRARDFRQVSEHAASLLRAAPPGRVVRTRHGDRMLLTEFTRTRVLELAVHGLDLAAGLDREPWITTQAAEVTAELLLPGSTVGSAELLLPGSAAVETAAETAVKTPAGTAGTAVSAAIGLRMAAGWDLVTLIAKLTGRAPVTPAEDKLLSSVAFRRLALG
jgi:uncharacterized protein (TIGR03083 family)